jgi:ribosomal protein L37AE/L43A
MQVDLIEEWRRLREHYTQLNDEELYELALDFADLTETAQQVLRDELRSRGLDLPQSPREVSNFAAGLIPPRFAPHIAQPSPTDTDQAADTESDPPHEYTWKTPLCEREDFSQAWQVRRVLEQAGIESWIEQPGARYSDSGYPFRVMVAADQLEAAIEIAARPIPNEIVEESQIDPQEYEPPTCPKCGAGDPVLEGVEPVNSWLCEACGNQWTQAADDANAEDPGKN